MGAEPESFGSKLLLPVAAVLVFVGLVAAARGIRRFFWWVAGLLSRWMGRRAARALGWLLAVVVTVGLLSGVLVDGILALTDRIFAVRDTTTSDTAVQPTTALRSGGPGSLVAWDTLGKQGRNFVGQGPTAAQIAAFTGTTAQEPIRAYAGIASADTLEDRAALAVADLDRAGGFDRGYLMVAGSTGTGWLDPAAMASFEYETGGNSAVVSIQYSYLPSWASFLVDQEKAREAGRALFDAVYQKWSALPAGHRPKLYGFGLSLGSYAAEAAVQRGGGHGQPHRRHPAGRAAGVQPVEPGIHRPAVIRAPRRCSRCSATGGRFDSPTTRRTGSRRSVSPGTGPGCCTCNTRPIPSSG